MNCYVKFKIKINVENLALNIVIDRFTAMYHDDDKEQADEKEEVKEDK